MNGEKIVMDGHSEEMRREKKKMHKIHREIKKAR